MNKLQRAINMAIKAHEGQTDRGGTPYINHPMYLALKMETEEEKIVALLHDVIEDSDIYDVYEIYLNFGVNIAHAVECISKKKDRSESYEDYLVRVKSNSLSLKVKLSDIKHNLQKDRILEVDEKYLKMEEKYKKALEFLRS